MKPRLLLILALAGASLLGAAQQTPPVSGAPASTTANAKPAPPQKTSLSMLSSERLQGRLVELGNQSYELRSQRKGLLHPATGKPLHETDPEIQAIDGKISDLSDEADSVRAEIQRRKDANLLEREFDEASRDGIEVQIQSVAHYRGMRKFQLMGIGLVIGLEGTGDTTKQVQTQTLYANFLKSAHLTVSPTLVAAKNVALVQVTATMSAFTKPGSPIDVTVSSIGDAKSLQGGTLVTTPLYGPTDADTVVATAMGALSIGGFDAGANGSSVHRNHVNVGIISGGGEVQTRLDSQVVFQVGNSRVLYLDLDESNPTTVSRIVRALNTSMPELRAAAVDTTTVTITIPDDADPSNVMSRVNQTSIFADTPAKVVINERTGVIVVGGNVTIGPAMVVGGNLNVRIDTVNDVSQPAPFSQGQTTTVANSSVSAEQDHASIAILRPTTRVWDLAKIFQALDLKPNDVIKILIALRDQGALKARIEIQ